jgi:L-alanine-DL-glutamate epimerase-like enolase superfamily enzyme
VDVVEEVGLATMLVVDTDPAGGVMAAVGIAAEADIMLLKFPLWKPHAPKPLVRLVGVATAAFAAQLLYVE